MYETVFMYKSVFVKMLLCFLLVSENAHAQLAKDSGDPHRGSLGNPLAST